MADGFTGTRYERRFRERMVLKYQLFLAVLICLFLLLCGGLILYGVFDKQDDLVEDSQQDAPVLYTIER